MIQLVQEPEATAGNKALDLGWLLPKFKTTALRLERKNYHLQG
jgi:hypothetical protein